MMFNGNIDDDDDDDDDEPETSCCVVVQEWQKLYAEWVVIESWASQSGQNYQTPAG